ncbi:hypothetical protein NDU88_008102 [Pleurodeles waltl]|uniref:Uncharacterized protein n=1 Tax=Pleurodeles waltl TaxID=8319 RepID=A0AAV7VWB5_PLEWA|nr:hypothetical protein NDU88_008102 [Pleurodeles waltl]
MGHRRQLMPELEEAHNAAQNPRVPSRGDRRWRLRLENRSKLSCLNGAVLEVIRTHKWSEKEPTTRSPEKNGIADSGVPVLQSCGEVKHRHTTQWNCRATFLPSKGHRDQTKEIWFI